MLYEVRFSKARTLPSLVFYRGNDYRYDMSVVELLKQVKALPAREREKLFLAILALEEESPVQPARSSKRVKWPDVEARAKRIFGDRVLPNLVLLERNEIHGRLLRVRLGSNEGVLGSELQSTAGRDE